MILLQLMSSYATDAVYDGLTLAKCAYQSMRSLDPEESKAYIEEIDALLKQLEPHTFKD